MTLTRQLRQKARTDRPAHRASCSRQGANGQWCNDAGHVPGCPMYAAPGRVAPAGHSSLSSWGFEGLGQSAEVVGDAATDSIR
jgi:hypothetical protein